MFHEDEPHPSPEQKVLTPELLEQYKAERLRLVAQTRELERLRQQVRISAEREAAAIVTTARRNVRQVLVDARRELLVLVAQLQAVGCDTQPEELGSRIVEGEAPTSSTATTMPAPIGADPIATSAIVTGARRDVREVLLEAQAELLALSEEARELRARIAKQHESARNEVPELAPPEAHRAEVTTEEYASEQGLEAAEPNEIPPSAPLVEEPAPAAAEPFTAPAAYASFSSPWRVWVGVAAALVVAAIAAGMYLTSNTTRSREVASAEEGSAEPLAARDPAAEAAPVPVASSGPATPAVDPSLVTVRVEARRPAWIRTTIDGRSDVGRTFAAGETRALTANREVVMRAGDAGAVYVSVNGDTPKPLGPDGQVVTRRFGRAPGRAAASPVSGTPAPDALTPGALAVQAPVSDVGTTGVSNTPAPPVSAEREILRATQRWFEAYFGGDSAAMSDIATSDFSIVDERPQAQRLPATMRGVDRGLQQVRIEVAGESAVMSARLTERAQVDGQLREYVAFVSTAWVRTDGRWRLMGLRLVDSTGDSRPF